MLKNNNQLIKWSVHFKYRVCFLGMNTGIGYTQNRKCLYYNF